MSKAPKSRGTVVAPAAVKPDKPMSVEELAASLEQINSKLEELMSVFWAMYDDMTFENVAWARADDACCHIAGQFVGRWV